MALSERMHSSLRLAGLDVQPDNHDQNLDGKHAIRNSKAPFTRYNLLSIRLSNGFDNGFDNRLYRVNGV